MVLLYDLDFLKRVAKETPITCGELSRKFGVSPTHSKRIIKKVYTLDLEVVCANCGALKHTSFFSKYTTAAGNLSKRKVCNSCRARQCDKEKKLTSERLRAQTNKHKAVLMFGSQCGKCNQHFPDACFDFHHLEGETKEHNPSHLIKGDWNKAKMELNKCIMLCKNCHAIVHYGGD